MVQEQERRGPRKAIPSAAAPGGAFCHYKSARAQSREAVRLSGSINLNRLLLAAARPYGYAQLQNGSGYFGSQQPPSAAHWLGTTVGGPAGGPPAVTRQK
jgi:hypothetical protein